MKKNKSRLKVILKPVLIGVGIVASMVLAFVIWLVIGYFPGFGDETSSYHPFRSAEKQKLYLDAYDKIAEKWPVASETFYLDTSFGKTYVRASGPADGPPMVLLHGAGATSLSWAPNIEALSANYRMYAFDNIYDVGRSIYKKKVKTEKDMIAWLDEVLDGLELKSSITLIGGSYGGFIAGRYALVRPQRLEKMVLIAPGATVLPTDREALKYFVLAMLPNRYFTKKTMYWLFEDLVHKDEESLKFVENLIDFGYLGKKCFKPMMLMEMTVMTDQELKSISVPTLVLVGEHEKMYSAMKAIQRLHEVAPQIKTELVPGAGHDLPFLQTEVVNKAILDFIHPENALEQVSETKIGGKPA